MGYFDAHCHLQDSRIGPKLPELIQEWRNIGGRYLVCCGAGQDDWAEVASIARRYPEVIPCFGLHPWYLDSASDDWESVLNRYLDSMPSGIGEIGLDFAVTGPDRDRRDRDRQMSMFLKQLRIANQRNLPVSVHVRKAWEACIQTVTSEGGLSGGGLVHSWSGSAEMVPVFEKLGFMISFSGSIAYPGNRRGIASLQSVSESRILIETDSPDILPRLPETRNQEWNKPSNLGLICRIAAETRGTPPGELRDQASANGEFLFRNIIGQHPGP